MIKERPFLIPFLTMASGLVIADQSGFLLPTSLMFAVFCCLAAACLISNRYPFVICVALFFFSWGLCALIPWKTPTPAPHSITGMASRLPLTIEGVVRSRPTVSADGSSLVISTEKVLQDGHHNQVSGDILLYVGEGDVTSARGDRIRFTTRVTVPRRLGLPGEFDYSRYLAFQGVAAIGRVAAKEDIVLIRGADKDSLLRRIDLAALRLGNFIRATEPDETVSSVLSALLLGDQKRIPAELSNAYTRAGVNHILSIGGFHLGIVSYGIVILFLSLATRSEYCTLHVNLRRSIVLLSLPAMLFYLFLTGAAPATARSVIMLVAFVFALYVERETDPINALLMAAFLLVSVHPPTLFDISFQLSFLALWGIIVLVPPVMGYFGAVRQNWLRTLIQFVIVSCAASCVTVIPVLFSFNVASLNGIVSNFLIVPLLGYGAVLAGFCALPFIYVFSPVAELLLWIAGRMVEVSNWLTLFFARLPVMRFHGITALDMLLFLTFMCCITFMRSFRIKAIICGLLPVAAIMVHYAASSGADGRLHITMLSVGQGESLLIKLPDGGTVLVDGGGYLHDTGRDFGERVLAPALFKLGVRQLDYVILSHSHPDHIGGLPYLVNSLPVGNFLEAAPGGVGKQYEKLLISLNNARTPVRRLAGGDEISLGANVHMKVLAPRSTGRAPGMVVDDMGMNDESLVFRLSFGSFSMLFTADAGFPAENAIIASGADLRSTVLKVGHHGSHYSTSREFLQQVNPRVALISAGSGNSFGLPSAATMSMLDKHGIRTYRTDRDGTIELVSDGATWTISTPYRIN